MIRAGLPLRHKDRNMGKATEPRLHGVYIDKSAMGTISYVPLIDRAMRVGARVFRAGSLVYDVLDAAAQAYQDKPLPVVMPELSDEHKVKTDLAVFLAEVRHVIGSFDSGIIDILEAFMAKTVADVAPEDRALFLQRVKERFSA